jgi:hypothetical protein
VCTVYTGSPGEEVRALLTSRSVLCSSQKCLSGSNVPQIEYATIKFELEPDGLHFTVLS